LSNKDNVKKQIPELTEQLNEIIDTEKIDM